MDEKRPSEDRMDESLSAEDSASVNAEANSTPNGEKAEKPTPVEAGDDSADVPAGDATKPPGDSSKPDDDDDSDDAAERAKEQVYEVSRKVGKVLSDFGSAVAKKSSDLYEQGKLEVNMALTDRKIVKLEGEVGKKLFNLWSMGRIEDQIIQDLLSDDLNELADIYEERAVLKELLENILYRPDADKE